MLRILVELRKMMKEQMARFEVKQQDNKGMGKFASVF